MGFTCLVCPHTYVKSQCKFYKLPEDPRKLALWKKALELGDDFVQKKCSRVCCCHFPNYNQENTPVSPRISALRKTRLSGTRQAQRFTERVNLKFPRVCSCHFPKNFNEKRLKSKTKTIKRKPLHFNMLICGVSSCRADSKKDNRKFYQVPVIDQRDGLKQLSEIRQSAWIAALGGKGRDPSLYKNVLVCDAHFISGSSAKLLDSTNPDWVPSQNMGGIEFVSVDVDDEDIYLKDSKSNFVCNSNVLHTNGVSGDQLSEFQTTSTKTKNVRPFRAGEILRNENGQYSFGCIYCDTINEDCQEMTKHIDSHFDTNGSILCLNTQNTAAPEFISCTVPEDVDMVNESDPGILINESFYQINEVGYDTEGITTSSCLPNALIGKASVVSADSKLKSDRPESTTEWRFGEKNKYNLKMSSELANSSAKWRFGEKYKLLYSKKDSSTSFATSAVLGKKSDGHHGSNQGARPVEPFKGMYTNDGMKSPTRNSSVVESETSRPPESIVRNIETEISSPQKLPLPKSSEITHTNIPLSQAMSVVEKSKIENQQTPGWRFGERYQIIYDNPPKRKRKTASSIHSLKLECYQCNSEPPVANESDPRPHKCYHCPELFPNHIDYRDHFLNVHEAEPYTCYQCKSEPTITNKSDPRRHKCHFCKEWVLNHMEFETHLKNVHEIDFDLFNDMQLCEFSCYVCEKDFPVKSYLREHMKTHHDKYLENQCPTCGLRFRSSSILVQHLKTHEGQTFKCEQCDKKFPCYSKLRNHLWSHKTELDYICDFCSKGFKMRKYLKRHMALHSGVKLNCRFCDATFNFSSCRRVHEKSWHNVV